MMDFPLAPLAPRYGPEMRSWAWFLRYVAVRNNAGAFPHERKGRIVSFYVAEGWSRSIYRYTDPDVFLSCDNPACDRAWVTGSGLICWALFDDVPVATRFTERLLIACDAACLEAAQQARRADALWHNQPRPYWSEPETVERWLDALRDSLGRDPVTTPIGEIVPAVS